MLKQIRAIFRSLDIFGKPISLKFDKDWNTHETKVGGTLTLIFLIFIIIYSSI